jgi:hypothetical protein
MCYRVVWQMFKENPAILDRFASKKTVFFKKINVKFSSVYGLIYSIESY